MRPVGWRRYHTILCKRMESAIEGSADSVRARRRSRVRLSTAEYRGVPLSDIRRIVACMMLWLRIAGWTRLPHAARCILRGPCARACRG